MKSRALFIFVRDVDNQTIKFAQDLVGLGMEIFASGRTSEWLVDAGVEVSPYSTISDVNPDIVVVDRPESGQDGMKDHMLTLVELAFGCDNYFIIDSKDLYERYFERLIGNPKPSDLLKLWGGHSIWQTLSDVASDMSSIYLDKIPD